MKLTRPRRFTRRRRRSAIALATAGLVVAVASCDAVLGIVEYPANGEDAGSDGGDLADAHVSAFDATVQDASGFVDAVAKDTGEKDAAVDAAETSLPDAYAPVACDGGGFQPTACVVDGGTTITGTILDPAGGAPVPGAVVYIPQAAGLLPPLTHGPVTDCSTCGDPAYLPGCSVASTVTRADGTFTLSDAPSGSGLPLVVQLGKWRRQLVLPTIEPCTANAIDPALTRMPGAQGTGVDMPHIAIATGCDQMECSLRKYGWADSEFTSSDGGGSVNIYPASEGSWVGPSVQPDGGEAGAPPGTLLMSDLTSSAALLASYDAVIFPCECNPIDKTGPEILGVAGYLANGGRGLFNHYSYTWLAYTSTLEGLADWDLGSASTSVNVTAFVNASSASGASFGAWLFASGASTISGQVPIDDVLVDFIRPGDASTLWLSESVDGGGPMQFSASVPIGSAAACGRIQFLDYHSESVTGTAPPSSFPAECGSVTAASSSERAIEYSIFDLLSCW